MLLDRTWCWSPSVLDNCGCTTATPYSTYDDDLMVAEKHLLDACRKLVEAADNESHD